MQRGGRHAPLGTADRQRDDADLGERVLHAVGKMYKADRALYIEGRCSNGGALTRHPITLAMKGERLAVTWNGEHSEMTRCR